MNIQIFGITKSFDTKKAERYFKERKIPFQSIDVGKYGMSSREFDSVLQAVGGIDQLIDWEAKGPGVELLRYLADPVQKEDKVFENFRLAKLPIVRNGKQATVGYCPDIWVTWQS